MEKIRPLIKKKFSPTSEFSINFYFQTLWRSVFELSWKFCRIFIFGRKFGVLSWSSWPTHPYGGGKKIGWATWPAENSKFSAENENSARWKIYIENRSSKCLKVEIDTKLLSRRKFFFQLNKAIKPDFSEKNTSIN